MRASIARCPFLFHCSTMMVTGWANLKQTRRSNRITSFTFMCWDDSARAASRSWRSMSAAGSLAMEVGTYLRADLRK